MHLAPSKIFCRIGIAAAIVAIAAPSDAQPPADATLPYDAAKARMKEARAHSIYHGQQTPKGAYPFIVALIQSDAKDTEEDNYAGQYCVGSLIADHWVLTTAQCVATDEDGKKVAITHDKVDVYAGSNDFKGGKRLKVKRVIIHPQFDSNTSNNDIALLELAENAPSNQAKPAAPATPQTEGAVAGVGKKVIAAGWGDTEKADQPKPQSLRHVEMDILDSGMCNANIIKYRMNAGLGTWARNMQVQFGLSDAIAGQVRSLIENNTGKVVNDNMICSGRIRTQRDTCNGDNGGPLFSKGADGRFILVGLTSWGEGCGQTDKGLFGIYTRVSRYSAWVQQNTK
jgi:secreted trypsin-like serine protease